MEAEGITRATVEVAVFRVKPFFCEGRGSLTQDLRNRITLVLQNFRYILQAMGLSIGYSRTYLFFSPKSVFR